MSKEFVPREYQELIIRHIINVKRCAVWAGMGMGKTSATLTALDLLIMAGEVDGPVLVLAPLRVARSTWPDEVAKWPHLRHLRVSSVVGSVGARRRALSVSADIYTSNYENLPWLIEYCATVHKQWPFKVIVADESTKLKGFRTRQGTKRAKALALVAHSRADRFIELTGTPSPNGLKDLWGQLWFLDAGVRLGRTWSAFKNRWFRNVSQEQYETLESLPFAQEQIQDAVRDICLSLDAKDYFDLEEPIVNTIYVDLPKKVREKYKEMESQMFAELEDELKQTHEIEALNAAAKTMKCLQLASGAAYLPRELDEDGEPVGPLKWVTVHDEKIEALKEVVEEAAGAPVLVAYHFKSDLARLQKAFPQGRALDKDPQTLRDWNKGKIPVLFAHPASAGHGLNLQDGGNILVFFSHTWNLEELLQIIERIGPVRQKQAGHDRPVFIHYIVARNTVDELVMQRRVDKREVQDILLEAVKKRKGG